MNRLLHSPRQLSVLIKTTRKARGLTQAEVASRLGVSQNRFSELEQDASGLTVERLFLLAKVLDLEFLVQKSGASPVVAPASSSSDPGW